MRLAVLNHHTHTQEMQVKQFGLQYKSKNYFFFAKTKQMMRFKEHTETHFLIQKKYLRKLPEHLLL